MRIIFQPDDRCLASIIKQIRSTHLAYPLFSLARMFLQEPARHWVQFTVEPAAAQGGTLLYQLGDEGPVTLDRATLERIAFDASREEYYTEQTVQKEPLKGNFANVARERSTGTLLGPTNHHGYQPALRALYESRFSRRMSFEDYRRNVEVVSDPALVERWKEEARTVTTIVTKQGEPPTTLNTPADARAHFRQHYFDSLVQSGTVRRVHGSVARDLPEPAMMQAIRQAHDTESRYPAQFVQLLREGLQNAGLHIFKHRKRVVYVSLSRPTPFVPARGAVSENVAAILDIIGKSPLCTRKFIAESLLAKKTPGNEGTPAPAVKAEPETSEAKPPAADASVGEAPAATVAPTEEAPTTLTDPAARAKAALAADLRFLVQAGHIIEFHNGTFDLPLPPKPKEGPSPSTKSPREKTADEVGADPAAAATGPDVGTRPGETVTESENTEPEAINDATETATDTPASTDESVTASESASETPGSAPQPVSVDDPHGEPSASVV